MLASILSGWLFLGYNGKKDDANKTKIILLLY